MTEQDDTADTPECGRMLRRMRERLGLSVDDVASELRLSPFQVRALEEDAWDRLPGVTYARGYLRTYARLLDLDAEKLLEGATTEELQIPAAAPAAQRVEEGPAADKPPRSMPWALLTVLVVVAVFAGYLWRTGAYLSLIPDMSSQEQAEKVDAQSHDTGTQSEESPAVQEETARAETSENAETEAMDETPLPEGWQRIVFQFNERSWIDLTDARGERLLYRSFQPGRRIEAEGRPPFRVFIGNAGGVSIEYAGRTIKPDAIPGRIHARLTVGKPAE